MSDKLPGLHHMTAIASDPQRNVDFYAGVLGLRLVKKTVNYDDPGTYHLYYGDALGRPGTILTFFPWPGAFPGKHGLRQATTTALRVPEGSLSWWQERLKDHAPTLSSRFGEQVLTFRDPDGLGLELVTRPGITAPEADAVWSGATVPAEYAISGMDGVTLTVAQREGTEALLTQVLGFTLVGEEDGRLRYQAGDGIGGFADVIVAPDAPSGRLGTGTVHHVAWRTPDDETELEWRKQLLALGFNVSPVMDRQYFHSIYFHEPGGVLFEIATNPPGFTADGEAAETLGAVLQLPKWLEPQRAALEQRLTPLHLPTAAETVAA
jgi:glyoxalase family protein